MFFKIKDKMLFRRYDEFGYIVDNSTFGYRFLNDETPVLNEKYVSLSGAVMLETLSKEPQDLDTIVEKLQDIFVGVENNELKDDAYVFFMQLADDGYLSYGETYEECIHSDNQVNIDSNLNNGAIVVENCDDDVFKNKNFIRSIHIEVASACNERCVHCYIPHEYKDSYIDSQLFYKIIEEGRALNAIHVTLSGGEPLLHKDILKFLSRCRELDLAVNILTNLTLLTDEMLEEMKRNPLLCVQTSIYSMDPQVHDFITKNEGSFEKTKNAILRLVKERIPVQISCPIMKQNKDTFNEVVEWGHSNNIAVMYDYVIFAAYDNSNVNLVNRLSLDDVEKAMESQMSQDYVDYLNDTAREKCALTANDPICSICRYYFCVSANGDVFPCIGWQGNIVGNLKTSSIEKIWEHSMGIQELRNIKRDSFPKCLNCENRGYCTICMMNNFNETGDKFKISDFHCKVAALMHQKVNAFKNSK